jgi:hypothetical protein
MTTIRNRRAVQRIAEHGGKCKRKGSLTTYLLEAQRAKGGVKIGTVTFGRRACGISRRATGNDLQKESRPRGDPVYSDRNVAPIP